MPTETLDHLAEKLSHEQEIAIAFDQAHLERDPLSCWILAEAASEAIALFVSDQPRAYGYRILCEAVRGCDLWSPSLSVAHGRFIAMNALLQYGTLELQLSGQPLYVRKVDAIELVKPRRMPIAQLEKCIQAAIDRAETREIDPTHAYILEQVRLHPRGETVSATLVRTTYNRIKPKVCRLPGRRRRRPPK